MGEVLTSFRYKSVQNVFWATIFWSGILICLCVNIVCFPFLVVGCACLNCAMLLYTSSISHQVAVDSHLEVMENNILRKYAKTSPQRLWTELKLNVLGRDITCRAHSFTVQSRRSQAPTLLLIHGNAASAVCYAECFELLSLDFNVVSLDLPGFGRSITDLDTTKRGRQDLADIGIVFWVEFIAKFLDSQGLTEVMILGHSYGGFISICFTEKYPRRVTGLILLSCAGIFPTMGELGSYWAVFFKFSVPQLFRRYLSPVGTWICLCLCWATRCSSETLYWVTVTQNPRGWGDISIADGISVSYIGTFWKHPALNSLLKITCPVLTVYGTEDNIIPIHQGRVLQDVYGIPCVPIPGAGHSPISRAKIMHGIIKNTATTLPIQSDTLVTFAASV